MRPALILAAALCCAAPVLAPATAQTVWEPLQPSETLPTRQRGPELATGTAGTLRALDKVSGAVVDQQTERFVHNLLNHSRVVSRLQNRAKSLLTAIVTQILLIVIYNR